MNGCNVDRGLHAATRRGWARALARPVAALLCALAWSAGVQAQVVGQDDRGVALPEAAHRIVSLLPSLTESVCALGACDRIVGTDRYSNWPASVRDVPKLGGLDDAQIERIVALRPDVVLVSTSARIIGRLEALGIRVVAMQSRDEADVRRTLALLAQMLGTPHADERVWRDIERDTQIAAARVPAALRGRRVYFEVDATPYAAGAGSFVGQTLERLGMENAVPVALGAFPKLNPEYVVRMRPDIVMASQRDLARMRERPGWDRLQALNDGRSCGFPSERFEVLVRPGPRIGDAALLLAQCLASIPISPIPIAPMPTTTDRAGR